MAILRDAPVGIIIRAITGSRFLKYVEEEPGFKLPSRYSVTPNSESTTPTSQEELKDAESGLNTDTSDSSLHGITLVTWYSETDPDNPHNWSPSRKMTLSALLFTYTFSAYIGSSIYSASIPGIQEHFGVSEAVASLGMTLYVFAYGIGPMLFSPLSEVPAIGRSPPYAVTFSLFALLTIPMALVDNMAGILVIRFLLGIFCSPALATVGASYADFVSPGKMNYVIALWGGGASLAPTFGPLVAGFAVEAKGWRWSSWELLWLACPVAILVLLTLPETSADKILLQRAQRLRKLTGRSDLMSESEVRQHKMTTRSVVFNALIKPWEINALDPAVLFTTVYMALAYGIYYSFFESFPRVFSDTYGFGLGATGLAFLSQFVGLLVAMSCMCAYFHFVVPRQFAGMDTIHPEERLWPGLVSTFLIPVGLFIFAWTARESIHWIVPMIGVSVSLCGVMGVTQAILIYIPFTYPRYAGSLFAANAMARCFFAGAAILFSPPMFEALGISGGVSLLAGCSVVCVFGMFGLYFWGASMRRRSRFAEK